MHDVIGLMHSGHCSAPTTTLPPCFTGGWLEAEAPPLGPPPPHAAATIVTTAASARRRPTERNRIFPSSLALPLRANRASLSNTLGHAQRVAPSIYTGE